MQWGCGAQQLTLRAALLHSIQPRLLWVPLYDGVSPKHPRQQRPDLHAARRLEERHQLVGVVVVACSSCKLPSSNEEVYTTTSNKDMHYDANFPATQWAFLYCSRTFKAASCMSAREQWTLGSQRIQTDYAFIGSIAGGIGCNCHLNRLIQIFHHRRSLRLMMIYIDVDVCVHHYLLYGPVALYFCPSFLLRLVLLSCV